MRLVFSVAICLFTLPLAAQPAPGDWTSYGRDSAATHYSPLAQIKPANVSNLKVAWTYHMLADAPAPVGGRGPRAVASQATPLAVNGIVYLNSPMGLIVALDGASGSVLWRYSLPGNSRPSTRGMEYWPGEKGHDPELLFGTSDGKLMAISAKTGQAIDGFGEHGAINLRTAEVMNGMNSALAMSAPPIVYKDVVITGDQVQEQPTKGSSGDVRAWNVKTGKLIWTFHTIPRAGEPGYETWAPGSTAQRSGVNVWNMMSVDARRGIAYLPIAAPAVDRWGADRAGDNLYSDTLVAVNAATGKKLWHYQLVHHDIWDFDLDTAPVLLEVRKNGKTIPAVAAINKSGYLFILDRVTGTPIYEAPETKVPGSNVPGEAPSPTQPIPVTPPPLARQSFNPDTDYAQLTPEHTAACKAFAASKKALGSVAFSTITVGNAIIRFPGSGGGAEWGGGAFDSKHGFYVINTNDMGTIEGLEAKPGGWWGSTEGADSFFMTQDTHLMCQTPPWGSLYAVNVNTGQIAWRTTLGVTDSLPPGLQNTGRPSLGGPIVTASGLIFIGGTDDSRFRAFDAATGKEIWTYKLDYSAHATPMTYRGKDGNQYVATVATGGSFLRSPAGGDSLVVFGLQ
ncbi:MAG: PQQ-binding-like beta-propeller repeat protein [Alphaproteobacteria bacterium]|nr:PQQ-binding-like beta-propeller repeat protein [Alphaproteobacteria bacterium]